MTSVEAEAGVKHVVDLFCFLMFEFNIFDAKPHNSSAACTPSEMWTNGMRAASYQMTCSPTAFDVGRASLSSLSSLMRM